MDKYETSNNENKNEEEINKIAIYDENEKEEIIRNGTKEYVMDILTKNIKIHKESNIEENKDGENKIKRRRKKKHFYRKSKDTQNAEEQIDHSEERRRRKRKKEYSVEDDSLTQSTYYDDNLTQTETGITNTGFEADVTGGVGQLTSEYISQIIERAKIIATEEQNTNFDNDIEEDSLNRTHTHDFRDNTEESVNTSEIKKNKPGLQSEHVYTSHACSDSNVEETDAHHADYDTAESISLPQTRKRKKKKRLKSLKKTSSRVGILNTTTLPPLRELSVIKECNKSSIENIQTDDKITDSPVQQTDADDTSQKFPNPLKLCLLITSFPVISFVVLTLIHVATIAATIGLVVSGQNVFPLVFDDLPLYIYNDARLKDLAWKDRQTFDGYIYKPVYGANIAQGYRSRLKDTVEVIYETPGNQNLLDSTYLNWIKIAEDRLYQNQDFQDHFCLLDYNDNCRKPDSILRFFDGTYAHIDSIFQDANFSNVNDVIYMASIYNETQTYLEMFLGKDSSISPGSVHNSITRSFFIMGWPLAYLPDYTRLTATDLETFLVDNMKPEIEKLRDVFLIERLDVYYISKYMLEHDLVVQAMNDLKLAIGSLSFIFVFMCIQTASIFVTGMGLLSIFSSFLLTNLIYRYVFQYIYFGFFHGIAIFLILGIGADDLFVFYDTWRLTGHNKYPSDAHRLSDCYRKAAKTTFVTSCTTMMAFLVSGLSPLLPVKTFGIFAGVLVGINYIWVIIYFPTIIILHHTKVKYVWQTFHGVCLSVCLAENMLYYRHKSDRRPSISSVESGGKNTSETNSARQLINEETGEPVETSEFKPYFVDTSNTATNKASVQNGVTDADESFDLNLKIKIKTLNTEMQLGEPQTLDLKQIEEHVKQHDIMEEKLKKPKKNFEDRNRVVVFLKNGFFYFMTKRIVRILIPILFLGLSIFFIHRATLIQPDTHQLRLFRENHNYAKASSKHYFSFKRNNADDYQRLYLVWGLLPADISECDLKSAAYCSGKPQYDAGFDMNTQSSQIAFKDLCDRLDAIDEETAEALRIRRNVITGKLEINCFVKSMDQYFQKESEKSEYGYPKYPATMDLTLPITADNVSTLMTYNSYIYRYSLPPDFNNSFEILVEYWMTNAYTTMATSDYFLYNNLLVTKEVSGLTKGAYYSYSGLYYGTKLQFLAIEVNTTMDVYSLSYKDGIPVYNNWENFISDINSNMPDPLKNGMQVTQTLWHWIHVQESLASSAITGIMVGLFSAWPILIFTTLNFVIGTLAVITIGLVTACVVGLIPLVGWKLGVLESINLCMVVGLSVDYIVHLAEAYRMSTSYRRLDRVQDMLESMGLSVVSGAITTMGAAVFMLFAKVQFFYQFGIFILSTVGISLLFSLLWFTTVMSLFGPQGHTGSVIRLGQKVVQLCRKEKDDIKDDKKVDLKTDEG